MTPHIFRALPGMRYERFHWWLSGLLDGRRVWLDGGDGSYPHPVRLAGVADYHVEHVCLRRTEAKILGNRAFCNDRMAVVQRTGQEDDVPGLPNPVWDYESRLV